MKKIPNFLISFFVLFSLITNAQWLALPVPSAPTNSPNLAWPIRSCPKSIVPIGDGKFLYTAYYSSYGNCGPTVFLISENDLNSSNFNLIYKDSLWPITCGNVNLKVYNDTVFSFLMMGPYGNQGPLYLTQNRLQSITKMFPLNFLYSASDHDVTKNYVYALGQTNGPLNLYRVNRTGTNFYSNSLAQFNMGWIYRSKLDFANDSLGYVLLSYTYNASKRALIKLTSFGMSAAPILIDSVDAIVDYQISDQGNIYVLKASGAVFKSTDEGISFSALSPAPQSTYTCIHFANNTTGFIGGKNGTLLKTQDGGNTWTTETSNTINQITSIYTFGYNTSYFIDLYNTVYKSQMPLGISSETSFLSDLSIFPNPADHSIKLNLNVPDNNLSIMSLKIYNSQGQIVKASDAKPEISLQDLPEGFYLLELCGNEANYFKRFVISR